MSGNMPGGPWAQFKTDKAKEADGVWVPFEGFRLRIRRTGKAYAAAMEDRLLRPHRAEIAAGTLPDETADPIWASVIAETLVADWDSDAGPGLVAGPDGEPLAFSVEAATAMLADLPELRAIVLRVADERKNYLAERIEADAKN